MGDVSASPLERLEAQVRRLRIGLIVLAVGLAAAVLAVIEAHRELHDITKWGVDTPALRVADGHGVASVGSMNKLSYFKITDKAGVFRLFQVLEDDGLKALFNDSAGRTRLRMSVTDAGAVIEILNEEGQVVWSAP